jgi:phosphomannomutase
VNAAFSWGKPVCVPVTFTAAADELAERAGAKLYRYGFCPDEMSVSAETAAREDNLFMRDGAALACMICSFMAKSGKTLGELTAEIPQFYTVERFAAADAGRSELMRIFGCRCDGGEAGTVICKGGERALVRPLKRRKGVMIYVESAKTEAAEELCGEIMKRLGK